MARQLRGRRAAIDIELVDMATVRPQVCAEHAAVGDRSLAGLRLDDVVTGVDGAPFADGCFAPLAAALQRAESVDGKLVLQIERDGKPSELAVKLKKLGPHATTPESGRMRQQLLDEARAQIRAG
jgi:hypothetical protein